MKKVSFEGFKEECLTFKKAQGASISKGDFVSVSANATVSSASAGEIVGKCVDVCDELVTVQVSGYMKAPILSGQTLTLGRCHIGIDAAGKVKILSGAPAVLITDIDTENLEVGFIL